MNQGGGGLERAAVLVFRVEVPDLGQVLDVYAPVAVAIEAPHSVGPFLSFRPRCVGQLRKVVAVPQPDLGNIDSAEPGQRHHRELVGGHFRVHRVGHLDYPVPIPIAGGQGQAVTLLEQRELECHPG